MMFAVENLFARDFIAKMQELDQNATKKNLPFETGIWLKYLVDATSDA